MVVAKDGSHHLLDGAPAYSERFLKVFGFYEGLAAAQAADGWLHIQPDGKPAYHSRFDWVGNWQQGRCVVRAFDGCYFHFQRDGSPAYKERYIYAGDFREGTAVVQRNAGLATHIDADGGLLHGRWFLELDVFHKGFARARDEKGWHHINRAGEPAYATRFAAVDAFYNGQAWVKSATGEQLVINEQGDVVRRIR
jgi:hypothetical protein